MKKEQFIKESLLELKVPETTGGRYNKSIMSLISEGYRKSNMTAAAASKITSKWFPDKPKNIGIFTYLCKIKNKKFCGRCDHVLDLDNFSSNKTAPDGLQSYCKMCRKEVEKPSSCGRTAKRKSAKLQATPKWADLEKIKEIYRERPEGYHVDHIIPLQGETVCGLHVENNLQYLPASENLSKGNKYS